MGLEPTTTGITILMDFCLSLLNDVDTVDINQQLTRFFLNAMIVWALSNIRQNSYEMATWWLHEKRCIVARPKKDAEIDLTKAQELTAGLIECLTCPT
jgi:hypothetical protein